MKKLSPTQQKIIDTLQQNEGATIEYFRGFGAQVEPYASIESTDLKRLARINISTFKSLRDNNFLKLIKQDAFHATYKLKTPTA